MRNFLAVLLALFAGLSASFGLVSWKLSEVLHQPEPVQEILGAGEAAEEFQAAIPTALGNMTVGATGIDVVDDAINQAVTQAASSVMSQDGFDAAWSQSLELTRTGWLDDLGAVRDTVEAGGEVAEDSTDAQLVWRLDPIVELTLGSVQEALSSLPGVGDISLETGELNADIALPFPPVTMLTAEQTVVAQELLSVWPAALLLAGLALVMALMIARGGSRWIVWLVSGIMVAISGAAVKIGYTIMQRQVVDGSADAAGAALVRPLFRGFQEWGDPQILVLIAVGAGVALIGMLGGFISTNRRRR